MSSKEDGGGIGGGGASDDWETFIQRMEGELDDPSHRLKNRFLVTSIGSSVGEFGETPPRDEYTLFASLGGIWRTFCSSRNSER